MEKREFNWRRGLIAFWTTIAIGMVVLMVGVAENGWPKPKAKTDQELIQDAAQKLASICDTRPEKCED
jgi:hypothetical protein